MKNIRFAICALIAALALGLVPPAAMAIDDPGIDTTYAAVLLAEDGDQETVLYTKNADERLYPASLTKVMTVLLAVEDIESGKNVDAKDKLKDIQIEYDKGIAALQEADAQAKELK